VGTKHDRVTRRENTRASGNKGRTHRHHQHHHDIRPTPDVGRQLLECKAPAPGMRLQQREVVWFPADGVCFDTPTRRSGWRNQQTTSRSLLSQPANQLPTFISPTDGSANLACQERCSRDDMSVACGLWDWRCFRREFVHSALDDGVEQQRGEMSTISNTLDWDKGA